MIILPVGSWHSLIAAGGKLADFGVWEKIWRDWEIVECLDSVKRSSRGFSIRHCNWNICRILRTLRIRKSLCHDFFKFHDFSTLTADCARLRGHRILKIVPKRWAVVRKSWYEAWVTPVSRFYDLLVSRNLLSKSKNREIKKIIAQTFLKEWEYVIFDWCSSCNVW